jgi:hypothetical protein
MGVEGVHFAMGHVPFMLHLSTTQDPASSSGSPDAPQPEAILGLERVARAQLDR